VAAATMPLLRKGVDRVRHSSAAAIFSFRRIVSIGADSGPQTMIHSFARNWSQSWRFRAMGRLATPCALR